jgi:hypothetical protein
VPCAQVITIVSAVHMPTTASIQHAASHFTKLLYAYSSVVKVPEVKASAVSLLGR